MRTKSNRKRKKAVAGLSASVMDTQAIKDAFSEALVCPQIFDAVKNIAIAVNDEFVAEGARCAVATPVDTQGALVACASVRGVGRFMEAFNDYVEQVQKPDAEPEQKPGSY